MKFLRLEGAYRDYLKRYRALHGAATSHLTYSEQHAHFVQDGFGWGDGLEAVLKKQGVEARLIVPALESAQLAWAREHLPADASVSQQDIVVAQVKHFAPDVLWFGESDLQLLKRIRSEVPSIRLVIGWTGSALTTRDILANVDVVLSCAPEVVSLLKQEGLRAHHMHHGFNTSVLERIQKPLKKKNELVFVGQVIRGSAFHTQRAKMLEQLSEHVNFSLYGSIPRSNPRTHAFHSLKVALWGLGKQLRRAGFAAETLSSVPKVGYFFTLDEAPQLQTNPVLEKVLHGPVFGTEMAQLFADSAVSLNIHADSSPEFASNMRLFEVTGVGGCLLTDWRKNLSELFEPDKEVATFKSAEECVEKAKWLLAHPAEAEKMAKASQARCLKDHTFEQRVPFLLELIQKAI